MSDLSKISGIAVATAACVLKMGEPRTKNRWHRVFVVEKDRLPRDDEIFVKKDTRPYYRKFEGRRRG